MATMRMQAFTATALALGCIIAVLLCEAPQEAERESSADKGAARTFRPSPMSSLLGQSRRVDRDESAVEAASSVENDVPKALTPPKVQHDDHASNGREFILSPTSSLMGINQAPRAHKPKHAIQSVLKQAKKVSSVRSIKKKTKQQPRVLPRRKVAKQKKIQQRTAPRVLHQKRREDIQVRHLKRTPKRVSVPRRQIPASSLSTLLVQSKATTHKPARKKIQTTPKKSATPPRGRKEIRGDDILAALDQEEKEEQALFSTGTKTGTVHASQDVRRDTVVKQAPLEARSSTRNSFPPRAAAEDGSEDEADRLANAIPKMAQDTEEGGEHVFSPSPLEEEELSVESQTTKPSPKATKRVQDPSQSAEVEPRVKPVARAHPAKTPKRAPVRAAAVTRHVITLAEVEATEGTEEVPEISTDWDIK